jgi:hypothetical protein
LPFLTDREQTFLRCIDEELDGRIVRYAWAMSRNNTAFRANIQAAIQADDWMVAILFGADPFRD